MGCAGRKDGKLIAKEEHRSIHAKQCIGHYDGFSSGTFDVSTWIFRRWLVEKIANQETLAAQMDVEANLLLNQQVDAIPPQHMLLPNQLLPDQDVDFMTLGDEFFA